MNLAYFGGGWWFLFFFLPSQEIRCKEGLIAKGYCIFKGEQNRDGYFFQIDDIHLTNPPSPDPKFLLFWLFGLVLDFNPQEDSPPSPPPSRAPPTRAWPPSRRGRRGGPAGRPGVSRCPAPPTGGAGPLCVPVGARCRS